MSRRSTGPFARASWPSCLLLTGSSSPVIFAKLFGRLPVDVLCCGRQSGEKRQTIQKNTRLRSFTKKVLRKAKSIGPKLRERRGIEGALLFPGAWATGGSDITKFTPTVVLCICSWELHTYAEGKLSRPPPQNVPGDLFYFVSPAGGENNKAQAHQTYTRIVCVVCPFNSVVHLSQRFLQYLPADKLFVCSPRANKPVTGKITKRDTEGSIRIHTTPKCSTPSFTSKQSSPEALYPAASPPARSQTEARNRSAPGRTAGKRLQRPRRVLPARVGIENDHNTD